MKYPNAYSGIRILFIADILMLISQLLAVALLFVSTVFLSDDEAVNLIDERLPFALILTFILLIVVLASSVTAFIMHISGSLKASKDNSAFKIALFGIIIEFTTSLIASFVTVSSISAILTTVSKISAIMIIMFVLRGIRNIAIELEDDEMEIKGDHVFKIYFLFVLITSAMNFFSRMFGDSVPTALFVVLSVAEIIFTVIPYIVYISYLKKAIKMLEQ